MALVSSSANGFDPAPRYRASWTTAGRLVEERLAWRDLAESAIEPNPLYGPNILIAAEKRLRGGRCVPVLIVRDRSQNGALAGLAPLEPRGWLNGFPGGALGLFVNPYIALSHPLIRRDGAADILAEMLRHLAGEGREALLFPYLAEKRGFAATLTEVVEREGYALTRVDGWSRPAIEPERGASGEQYARAYLRKNRRSSNERRMRRLTDLGVVAFKETLTHEAGGPEALQTFLQLESLGWKGDAETALISRDGSRQFACEGFSGQDSAPRVRIRALTLDDRPIAMALDLESQGVAYAFKAAYDPAYARHAPGLALDAHTAACIGDGFEIERLDSLAQAPIAQEGVWRQEEPVGRYVLALSAQPARAETLAARLRAAAAVKSGVKRLAQRGREIAARAVSLPGERKWALAIVVVASLPIVSLLKGRLG